MDEIVQPNKKKSFILYSDLLEKLAGLTAEQKGYVFQAILEFENGLEISVQDPVAIAIFNFIKPQMIELAGKWEKKAAANRENGKKGGRPKKTQANPGKPNTTQEKPIKPNGFENKPSKTQPNPKKPVNVNVNVFPNGNNKYNRNSAVAGLISGFSIKTIGELMKREFGMKITETPNRKPYSFEIQAIETAKALQINLNETFLHKNGQQYQIANSWFKLFKRAEQDEKMQSRIDQAISFFIDMDGWIEHNSESKFRLYKTFIDHGREDFLLRRQNSPTDLY